MTHQPDLELAQRIVDDGFDAHHHDLIDLIDRARHIEGTVPLLPVVVDCSAPTVVRHRALGRILTLVAAASSSIDQAAVSWAVANVDFGLAFERLLSTWNSHQGLRRSGASTAELLASRVELDDARLAMAQVRSAGFGSQAGEETKTGGSARIRPISTRPRTDLIDRSDALVRVADSAADGAREGEPCPSC